MIKVEKKLKAIKFNGFIKRQQYNVSVNQVQRANVNINSIYCYHKVTLKIALICLQAKYSNNFLNAAFVWQLK